MWSLTFACPPNVADLNLAYVHPTPWSFWSSITLASIVHLSFLLIASPAYIKPASESMRAPLHRWWTHRSNSNLDVWLVGEWMSNFASPSSSSPVATILIQQWLGRLHLFFFLQGGWCVIWEHRGRRYGCSSGGRHVGDRACCHAVKGPRYARLRPLEYLFLTHICI